MPLRILPVLNVTPSLGATEANTSMAPRPGEMVADALPASCPECPPPLQCSPCMPFQCPDRPAGALPSATWRYWTDPATGKMKCVIPMPLQLSKGSAGGDVPMWQVGIGVGAIVLAIAGTLYVWRRYG